MSNPELEERTETKSKISCTAFQLFCQRGIKSVSMDDIAQFLSMSKKTIYKWFENKNKMVLAVKRPQDPTPARRAELLAQLDEIKRFYGLRSQALETLLRVEGRLEAA